MPSKTKRQARTMAGACKNPEMRKRLGIPKKVACEHMRHDQQTGLLASAMKERKR